MADESEGKDPNRVRAREEEIQRLRAEVELARAEGEDLFNAFMAHCPVTAFIKDADGRLLYINPAFEQAFSFAGKDWKDKTDAELWPPDTAEVLRENDLAILASGVSRCVEETVVHTDGPHEWATVKFRFLDRHGRCFLAGMGMDLTEQRRLQALLSEASRMEAIGRLAGGVAHDFNNLLTAILGNCELAKLMLLDGAPIVEQLDDITSAAERAAVLTRQLLGFARRQIIAPKVLSLNTIVGQMRPILRRLVSEEIEIRYAPLATLGNVRIDPSQVEQVLLNLVVNASDAMPSGGRLTIETQNLEIDPIYAASYSELNPGRYALLVVSDTGTGMSHETIQRIFEPFFTTKALGKGTGLGLATCHGIVKQNGGHIWVYSEPGEGTTFKVCLPRVEAEAENLEEKTENLAGKHMGKGETVLVVDDDALVRRITADALRWIEYDVIEAASGESALTVVREHAGPIHLLISDVIMPGMRGPELVAQIAKLRPGVRAMFISGYTANALSDKEVDFSGIELLEKPFMPGELARKVREVLSGPPLGVPPSNVIRWDGGASSLGRRACRSPR
jgi:two-component system cell cycle sensor histidine kinase/response regulator CckA